jgi:hypothetical protein
LDLLGCGMSKFRRSWSSLGLNMLVGSFGSFKVAMGWRSNWMGGEDWGLCVRQDSEYALNYLLTHGEVENRT